ncbi:hypothetical protein AAVH_26480 [Aphelenchoides avenae]|nr:hypothetical protein AAVH_26480 [Aphelenchus avenae]
MKRQRSRQTTLEAYFGKRSRVAAAEGDQPDDVVVVSTGMTALQMIADAYADDEDVQDECEQAIVYASPEDVEHDHGYCTRTTQAGGAFGFDSSDEEPPSEANDNISDTTDEEGNDEHLHAVDVDAEELNLEDLYEVVDHRVKRIKKFGLNGYATKFVLKDDERVDQPVEMLRHVLQRFIDDALENSRENDYSTDWMGLTFLTDGMKKGNGGKGEWLVPFNPPNENNADKILQEMEKFDQSENSPELFGNQITMVVTTIRRPVGGAMDRLIRKKQIRRAPKDPAIVEINNRDNLCLFRAIEVHRFYHETGEGEWKQAQRYAGKGELDLAASTLRARAGIRRKSAYGLDDAKAVFEYLQKKYPDEYRILIFSASSKQETVYNSGNNAKYNICLYHHNGHYDVIKTPQKFFGDRNYCVDCETTYHSVAFHRDCKLRCGQCFRSGPGFPCTGDWPVELECPDCRKFFANQECRDAHKPHSCNTFHRCPFCFAHYTYKADMKNGGHECGETYCRKCRVKHRGNAGCYIRPRGAKESTPHRIVAYDVEAIIQKSRRQPLPASEEETGSDASAEDEVHAAEPFLVDTDFMRLKEEATGWEDIAKIEDPVARDRAMDQFIDDYCENTKKAGKGGVRLRKDNVKENKALRCVMKLFLNCLWGRLAMRPNKSHTEFIRSPAKLYKLLGSTSKIVKNIIQIDKDTVRVEWCYVDRFEQEDENSNVVYAMFTTSYGRAELYKHMCAVEESAGGAKGAKFLYGDTDSIAYVRKKGTEPIVPGRYLGDMKDEYPKHTIEEFICGGNKQYGLLLRHNETGQLTTKQKIRGITLNSVTSEMLRYEKMKEMILHPRRPDGEVPTVKLPYTVIRRDHYAKVYSLAMEKIYRPIFMKGWIDSNLEIWPHGYVKPEHRGVDPGEQLTESEYYMTLVL